jgi:hypothetical protein
MPYRLTIAGDLAQEADDLTRYQFRAETPDFYASTLAWGGGSEHNRLADALRDFPSSVPGFIDFKFGHGGCALRFETVDGFGHCCVWATLAAEYPSGASARFQQASICIYFEPAALDGFRADLRRFERGRLNEAVLEGHAP